MLFRSSKRFELSKEPYAVERIKAIKEAIRSVKEEHPEVLSFALFGSHVKGNPRPDSDIDMYVFTDADIVEAQYPEDKVVIDKKWDFNLDRGEGSRAVIFRWKDFSNTVKDQYRTYVIEALRSRTTLEDRQMRNIYPCPISTDIVDEMVDGIAASYKEYPHGIESSKMYFGHHIEEVGGARETTLDSRVEPNQLLYSMFFLDVGGGLRPYRRHLIERLSALGEVGEKIWADLIHSTEAWEQRLGLLEKTSNKHYPRSLKAARQMYG